ncbi:mercury transporter MerT [Paraburkholderia sp. CNPSo 3157]|uniref:Mercuric transport protein MerT n=2 Tax=Paraburkholderia franconis TaxID=2654983 RepID=A0A7X1TKI2_9BURK|nr:mercury transporter MerT [Paraburkholderia franconis]
MRTRWTTTGSLLAGAAAALGASACCAGPFLLVVVGMGGAWSSRLTALRPFQPLFIAASHRLLRNGLSQAVRPSREMPGGRSLPGAVDAAQAAHRDHRTTG